MVASGRDLRTDADGTAHRLATTRVEARIAFMDARRILRLRAEPPEPAFDRFAGLSAASGFRSAIERVLPGEAEGNPLRYQLLDDLPTALLVSGYALSIGEVESHNRRPRPQMADLCAGWATGGTILVELERTGAPPIVIGPSAPSLLRADDPQAWHEMPPAPKAPHGMRRWRRLDVWREDRSVAMESFFRDSYADPDGAETIVHEYTVHAAFDPQTMTFTRSEAVVGVLPWTECPSAAASAGRLVGMPVEGLRTIVRDTFVGPPTCTHLNDTLRSFAAAPYLMSLLDPR